MNDFPVSETASYCTAAQVFRVLQEANLGVHVGPGELSKTDVEEAIIEAQDEVDRFTGQAWRERKVTNEHFDLDLDSLDIEGFALIELGKIHVRTFAGGSGDKIEVWEGNAFTDYVATKTLGRNADYYVAEDRGSLYVRVGSLGLTAATLVGAPRNRFRVTFRYGLSQVPKAIQRATRLLAASLIVTGETYGEHGEGGSVDRVRLQTRAERWERMAYSTLARYKVGRFA